MPFSFCVSSERPALVHTVQLPQQKHIEVPVAMNNPLPFPSSIMAPIGRPTTVPQETDEDEGLKRFEQVSLVLIFLNYFFYCNSDSVVIWSFSRRQRRW